MKPCNLGRGPGGTLWDLPGQPNPKRNPKEQGVGMSRLEGGNREKGQFEGAELLECRQEVTQVGAGAGP